MFNDQKRDRYENMHSIEDIDRKYEAEVDLMQSNDFFQKNLSIQWHMLYSK